jgi:nucleoside-diphosphate-sugar epimerase
MSQVGMQHPVVLVTGALTPLGAGVLPHLVGVAGIGKLIALAGTRSALPGVTWRVADLLDPAIASKLNDVDVVVHLDLDLGPDSDPVARSAVNQRGAETVLTAAAAAGVPRVVLVTSAMVYGAVPENPVPLAESAPLGALASGIVGDLLEIERLAVAARKVHPGLDVVVLRPAALVGPGLDSAVTRHFAAPRLVGIREAAMRWQFCHFADLAAAVELAVKGAVSGSLAVAGPGWLEQDAAAEIAGLRRVDLPATVVFAAAERLHRAHLTPTPAADLAFLSYPWVVAPDQLLAAGWTPKFDNRSALTELLAFADGGLALAGRRVGRRDATLAGAGAAGATVALVGAAAFVRRARKSRGR